jgi:phosphonate transport system substrate-binding protein
MTDDALLLGAVAYDPKVVTIWDGFKAWFAGRGLPFDYVLYTTYERQVDAHLAGHVDVAWNSPLAWVQARRVAAARGKAAKALVMRDTDRDLTTALVVRADSPHRSVDDLEGATIGVGASDSPQATLLPLAHLQRANLAPQALEVVWHDRLVGKHGDHIGGERDAAKALLRGDVDVACVLDANLLLFGRDGTWPAGSVRVLEATGRYDHCNMTVIETPGAAPDPRLGRFAGLLLSMDYEDPSVRHLLDLEGLKAWKPGRTDGYAPLEEAVDRLGTLDKWLAARGVPAS